MSELLNQPIYLAPLATTVSIAITVILWLFNRRDKQLNFEIMADVKLVTLPEELGEHVCIQSDGNEVHNVRVLTIKLMNAGHVPIRPSEYADKIALEFKGGHILSAQVIDGKPEYLYKGTKNGESLIESCTASSVVFRPALLNPNNFFVSKILVAGAEGEPILTGHIEGINTFHKHKESKLPRGILAHAGMFCMIGAALFFDPQTLMSDSVLVYLPNILFFMIGYLMLLTSIYEPKGRENHG